MRLYWKISFGLLCIGCVWCLTATVLSILGVIFAETQVLSHDDIAWASLGTGLATLAAAAAIFFPIRHLTTKAIDALGGDVEGVFEGDGASISWMRKLCVVPYFVWMGALWERMAYPALGLGDGDQALGVFAHAIHIFSIAAHGIVVIAISYEETQLISLAVKAHEDRTAAAAAAAAAEPAAEPAAAAAAAPTGDNEPKYKMSFHKMSLILLGFGCFWNFICGILSVWSTMFAQKKITETTLAWCSLGFGLVTAGLAIATFAIIRYVLLRKALNAFQAAHGATEGGDRAAAPGRSPTWTMLFYVLPYTLWIGLLMLRSFASGIAAELKEVRALCASVHLFHLVAAVAHGVIVCWFAYKDAETIDTLKVPADVEPAVPGGEQDGIPLQLLPAAHGGEVNGIAAQQEPATVRGGEHKRLEVQPVSSPEDHQVEDEA